MVGTLSIAALIVSALLLGTMILALVLLRKGEGPRYSASRAYEENRREALRALTGETGEALPPGQWYDPVFESPVVGAEILSAFREAVREALRAVAPEEAGLEFDAAGVPRLSNAGARIVPAVSTAALREDPASEPAGGRGDGPTLIGVVLFNPEPPGGAASRVTLPVQALFPALERENRHDLIRRFEALREEASSHATNPGGSET